MVSTSRYEQLLPGAFRARLAAAPIAWLPLGTLEWHGEHMALGSDALIARGIFERAADRFGGIVFPAIHLGPDRTTTMPDGRILQGMEFDQTTAPPQQLDGSCYWAPEGVFLAMCEAIVAQAARAGFRVLVADGHGPSRRWWGHAAALWESRYPLRLVSVARDLGAGWRCQNDHAARNETSLLLALAPTLVDMARLPGDRANWPLGVGGEDPRDASAAYGESLIAESLDCLAAHLRRIGAIAGA
ncbi:MAG: creatininase family protein [Chloroflexi bacterium]|nr:creatininase family protein [Chloroflexota bacterium]